MLPDPQATFALGEFLGQHLRAGQALALRGDLGAGKTSLARGVGAGLGLDDPGAVCSPTYLLVIEHPGPLPMLHIDAYLPAKTRGFLEDGGMDYLAEVQGVVVVEWAERLADLLPPASLDLELRPTADGKGRVAIITPPAGGDFAWLAGRPKFPPGR